jgi:hypothetical protein
MQGEKKKVECKGKRPELFWKPKIKNEKKL